MVGRRGGLGREGEGRGSRGTAEGGPPSGELSGDIVLLTMLELMIFVAFLVCVSQRMCYLRVCVREAFK